MDFQIQCFYNWCCSMGQQVWTKLKFCFEPDRRCQLCDADLRLRRRHAELCDDHRMTSHPSSCWHIWTETGLSKFEQVWTCLEQVLYFHWNRFEQVWTYFFSIETGLNTFERAWTGLNGSEHVWTGLNMSEQAWTVFFKTETGFNSFFYLNWNTFLIWKQLS